MRVLENIKTVTTIQPQLANNTTVNGSAVEVAGFGQAVVVVAIGASDVAATALYLEESDDGSSWTTVTGGEITGANLPAGNDDNKQWAFVYNVLGKGKRYVRPVITVGNATGAYIHAYAMLAEGGVAGTDASKGWELSVNC